MHSTERQDRSWIFAERKCQYQVHDDHQRKTRRIPTKTSCCGQCLVRKNLLFNKWGEVPYFPNTIVWCDRRCLHPGSIHMECLSDNPDETECALVVNQSPSIFKSSICFLEPCHFAQFVALFAHVKLFPNGFISIDGWFSWTFSVMDSIISSIVPLLFT